MRITAGKSRHPFAPRRARRPRRDRSSWNRGAGPSAAESAVEPVHCRLTMACADRFRRLVLGGGEVRRHDDLEHFAIIGVVEHRVPDLRRLDPAAALSHDVLALPLELVLHPALEQIDHLELHIMVVALAHLVGAWRDHADDLRQNHPVGRLGNSEIAVSRVAPQPVMLELAGVEMADGEFLPRRGSEPRLRLSRGLRPGRAFRTRPKAKARQYSALTWVSSTGSVTGFAVFEWRICQYS